MGDRYSDCYEAHYAKVGAPVGSLLKIKLPVEVISNKALLIVLNKYILDNIGLVVGYQSKTASLMGVDPAMICQVLNGKRAISQPIAELLGYRRTWKNAKGDKIWTKI